MDSTEPHEFEIDDDALEIATGAGSTEGFDTDPNHTNNLANPYVNGFVPFDSTF